MALTVSDPREVVAFVLLGLAPYPINIGNDQDYFLLCYRLVAWELLVRPE
jgi:hypothetical protein